ncbi:hypothetical protein PBCVOR070422_004L [Paramecium bursaria Chlorella virus OR0704.2.2]|nr:hypothetical protein PBCVCZ2_967R [Paramecium bursaria Chlorella virus CZ-2]AGE58944.1 hypothetical protein PBCVOR070422_004L [Paramecium bursaria Chlorella virus OR0704.2.2]
MVSIKQFFSAHAMLYSKKFADAEKSDAEHVDAEMYHVDVEVPEQVEAPVIAPEMDALNLWSPWAAKTKAAVQPAPPAGETKYTLDHEMDALNLWSPWAAKTKAAKGMAPLTERELENIKNKSWTVERRA